MNATELDYVLERWHTFSTHGGGINITLTASGVETLASTIFNEGDKAAGEAKLRLTCVTLAGLGNCKVPHGMITTNWLSSEIVSVSGVEYERISAPSGSLFTWGLEKRTLK